MSHIDWHGDEALAHVRAKMVAALHRAAMTVSRRAKELLSVPGTAFASGHGKKKKGARITGAVVSQPGEPPRKQTGRLRASVTIDVDAEKLEARVGTNVKYGRYLEMGTRKGILPRPWLRRALAECHAKILEILSS